MKLISPIEYSILSDELNEFVTLCNKYNYQPTKEDVEDIVKFLLLYNSASTTLCESILIDKLYESSVYDPQKDWESATGLAVAGGALAVIGSVWAVKNTAKYIKYLFKKGKVKKAIAAEYQLEFDKLEQYKKLNILKAKVAELEGNPDDWIPETPRLTSAVSSKED
jgi:hypothetical protein